MKAKGSSFLFALNTICSRYAHEIKHSTERGMYVEFPLPKGEEFTRLHEIMGTFARLGKCPYTSHTLNESSCGGKVERFLVVYCEKQKDAGDL